MMYDVVSNHLTLYTANSDGTFKAAVTFGSGYGTSSQNASAYDVNGDGKLDILLTDNTNGTIGVMLNNGNGTFQSAVSYNVGSGPRGFTVGDFTGDGVMDLAVALNGSNAVSILAGNSNGTFKAATTFAFASSPILIATTDINGDSIKDLIGLSSGGYTDILLGNGNGTFKAAVSTFSPTTRFALGDVNGDGKTDFAATDSSSNTLGLWLNGRSSLGSGSSSSTTTTTSVALTNIDLTTSRKAYASLVSIESATSQLATDIALIKGSETRLGSAIAILEQSRDSHLALANALKLSNEADDLAAETKMKIILDANTAMFAQANLNLERALSLLNEEEGSGQSGPLKTPDQQTMKKRLGKKFDTTFS
jgi:hypothetical protein